MELVIGKSDNKEFSLNAQELVTGRTCLIAQSGAGKSWTLAVICEKLCKANIGFIIIDTEGEYFSLKEKFELLWVGSDENADLDIEKADIKQLMQKAIKNNIPVIFDVSETDMREKVIELSNALYDIESELRTPYLMIIEEADKFIPQSRDSIKKIEEISRRGRKRGLGMLVATQRPSLVNKNVLSQCNNQIIGKLSIENDLRAVDLFFGSRKELEELATLEPGEFFIMGGLVRQKTKIKSGMRETKHKGLTPKLIPKPAGKISELISKQEQKVEEPESEAPAVAGKSVVMQISKEQALEFADKKRKRKFLAFGTEEKISSVELIYHPLVLVEAKHISGLLLKKPKTAAFVLDGINADLVEFRNGMRILPGFSKLIGLSEEAINIFTTLNAKGATITDLAAKTKLSESAVRDAIKLLQNKKLITESGKAGHANIYIPLDYTRLPKLNSMQQKINLDMKSMQGRRKERKITEQDIRTILKGLESTAEIIKFQIFYYPIYEARFASNKGVRKINLDAVTGVEI